LGTTELGWGALLHVQTLQSGPKDRSVGTATGVSEVAVLRQDGTLADPGEFGLLGAKGPAITAGYWNDADTTYRSRLAGYWLTGDIAYRDASGRFYQVDRAVDAIETVNGIGYSVLMEEVLLGGLREIKDCTVVAGRRDGVTVAVAVVRCAPREVDPMSLLIDANLTLRTAGHPEITLLEDALSDADFPLGVTGKSLKRELRQKYSDITGYVASNTGLLLALDEGIGAAAGTKPVAGSRTGRRPAAQGAQG
jgi:acyl-coenzyme A synthetase/AMP-(fatty) acid ligase